MSDNHIGKQQAFTNLVAGVTVAITKFSNRQDLTPQERAILQTLSDSACIHLDTLEELVDA